MKESSKMIGLVILLGALAGAVLLVQRIQETRRGATYGAVDVIILPTEKSVKTGDKLVVSVGFDAKEHKPSGVDLRIKYDQTRLRAVEVKPVILQTGGGPAFFQSIEDVLDTRIYQENGWVYLAGINMEENESKMVSVQTLALITFEVIGNGGVATVALDANYNNIIGGFKPEGGDLSLAINPSRVATYTVAASSVTTSVKITPIVSKIIPSKTLTPAKTLVVSCMWCGRDCIPKDPTRTYNCLDVMPPEGSVCVAENGQCVIKGDGVVVPTSPKPSSNPISYATGSVILTASDFRLNFGNETYLINKDSVQVHSDPPEFGENQNTTLELTWNENGKEMRLYLYFNFVLAEKKWKLYELRTYDGRSPGNWLYYNVSDENIGGLLADNPYQISSLLLKDDTGRAILEFRDLKLSLNFVTQGSVCGSCPSGATPRNRGNANCDGGVDLTDFEFWRSEMFDQGGYLGTVKNDWRADFDCDGKVSVFDFEQWRRNRQ